MELNHLDQVEERWGPFSKKYHGLSHLPHYQHGSERIDFTLFPTLAYSGTPLPDVNVPSGVHPMYSTPDHRFYEMRHELIGMNVFADVAYTQLRPNDWLIRVRYENHDLVAQEAVLNLFTSLESPNHKTVDISRPESAVLINATQYESIELRPPRPWRHLVADAYRFAEMPDLNARHGSALGEHEMPFIMAGLPSKRFGSTQGDQVRYRFTTSTRFRQPVALIRYRTLEERDASGQYQTTTALTLELSHMIGNTPNQSFRFSVSLPASDDYVISQAMICDSQAEGDQIADSQPTQPVDHTHPDDPASTFLYRFNLNTLGGLPLVIDSFVIVELDDAEAVTTSVSEVDFRPQHTRIDAHHAEFSYQQINRQYEMELITPNPASWRLREVNSGNLQDAVISRISNPDPTFDRLQLPFSFAAGETRSSSGYFANLVTNIQVIPPQGSLELYLHLSSVELSKKDRSSPTTEKTWTYEAVKKLFTAKEMYYRSLYPKYDRNTKYDQSIQLLNATLLTNIVYPIRYQDHWILHYTPGKRWDSLYTWDSGFISLGMLHNDYSLTRDIIQLYLSGTSEAESAFTFHGTPLPVHLFVLAEYLNVTQDISFLRQIYPQAVRQFNFLRGAADGSTTDRFKSGLTTTYDYFYNASGMDDYPPQAYSHRHKLSRHVAPAIASSMVILSAKLLAQMADRLDLQEDIPDYENEIEKRTKALQEWSWDEDSGYFSYVVHDSEGEPQGHLTTSDGVNLNCGVDGIYPYVAGAVSQDQAEKLLRHLKNPSELWSPIGISAVDQSAPYYRAEGYWNGTVWFPHQWFIWKALLDNGEASFARQLALTALDTFHIEASYSHYTYEFYRINSGRGGFFHHFGGLSSPLLVWFQAYYVPGNISTGYNLSILERDFDPEQHFMTFTYRNSNRLPGQHTMIVTLTRDSSDAVTQPDASNPTATGWIVLLDNKEIEAYECLEGTLEITIPNEVIEGTINIRWEER